MQLNSRFARIAACRVDARQDRHSKCPRGASCSCAVRPPTQESASAKTNEIAFTYGDERGHSGHANPRDRTSMPQSGWPQDNASERSAEVADSRGQVVALEGCSTLRSLAPPRGRRRPIVRLVYATGSAPSIPGLLSSSFSLGSLGFLGLSEQGAHRYRGRADGQ